MPPATRSYSTDDPLFATRAASYFEYAELGAARWYELDVAYQPQRICLSQGITIFDRATYLFQQMASETDDTRLFRTLDLTRGIDAAWFPALLTFARRFVVGNVQAPVDQQLLAALSTNPDRWPAADYNRNLGLITLMFVWVAVYQQPLPDVAETDPNAFMMPFARLGLPAETAPFGLNSDPPDSFPAGVIVPNQPRCYPWDSVLRHPINDPRLPFPTPLGSGSQAQPRPAMLGGWTGTILTGLTFTGLMAFVLSGKK